MEGVSREKIAEVRICHKRLPNKQRRINTYPFFKIPQEGIETIRSKLVMKIYDEYVNILRTGTGQYSMEVPQTESPRYLVHTHSTPHGSTPPYINSLET